MIKEEDNLKIEKNIINCLENGSQLMARHTGLAAWSERLSILLNDCKKKLAPSKTLESKFNFVQERLEPLFGGMGSLNDIGLPPDSDNKEFQQFKKSLNNLVKTLQQIYWKKLGRESHADSEFQKFSIGDKVTLKAGAVIRIESNGKKESVPTHPSFVEREWVVRRYEGCDVTNMPLYLLGQGKTSRLARHIALDKTQDEK